MYVAGTVHSLNDIFWSNDADFGRSVYIGPSGSLTIDYGDLEGGPIAPFVEVAQGGNVTWGPGMIDEDPLFVSLNTQVLDFHLRQGEFFFGEISPCVDAGDPAHAPFGSTGCLGAPDVGRIDIGWHGEASSPVERAVPAQHATIQAAIDASSLGDTILVSPGTYVENLSFGGRRIELRSADGPALTRMLHS